MRAIGRVEDGKIVVYGSTGGTGGLQDGSPVYIYNTQEEFDADVAENKIPVGALVIKTYDDETGGGAEVGIKFSIEDGILYATYDDGTEETEGEENG